jgi:AraC-like DNA-binding protein
MESADSARRPALDHDVLSAYEAYRGAELDVLRGVLTEFFPYCGTVEPVAPPSQPLPSIVRGVRLGHMALGVMRFGAETRLNAAPLAAYHVALSLNGNLRMYTGSRLQTVRPGVAVATVMQPILIPSWPPDAAVLGILIRPSSLESEFEAITGRRTAGPVRLAPEADLTRSAGRSWLSVVGLLLTELATTDSLTHASRSHREELEHLLMRSLLRAWVRDPFGEAWREDPPARRGAVKAVIDAIESAPGEQWSLSQLAHVAGISGRRLEQGFREQVGISPLAYLQNVRLERAHHDLLGGAGRVTEVAMHWGFTHLGRFAGAYRARYGESPSETQRRSRSIAL